MQNKRKTICQLRVGVSYKMRLFYINRDPAVPIIKLHLNAISLNRIHQAMIGESEEFYSTFIGEGTWVLEHKDVDYESQSIKNHFYPKYYGNIFILKIDQSNPIHPGACK